MKLYTSQNTYKSSNNYLEISDDLKEIKAVSYSWWSYIMTDKVGNVFFNHSTYSSSTNTHQRNSDRVLDRLGIKVNCTIYNTTEHFGHGIKSVLRDSISSFKETNRELYG